VKSIIAVKSINIVTKGTQNIGDGSIDGTDLADVNIPIAFYSITGYT